MVPPKELDFLRTQFLRNPDLCSVSPAHHNLKASLIRYRQCDRYPDKIP